MPSANLRALRAAGAGLVLAAAAALGLLAAALAVEPAGTLSLLLRLPPAGR